MLTQITLEAWERSQNVRQERPYRAAGSAETSLRATAADIQAITPDISPEDNRDLAAAAQQLSAGLAQLVQLTGNGPALRKAALRMFAKFADETLSEQEIEQILKEGETAQ